MPKPSRFLPTSLEAQRFLIRARQYHAQAVKLTDMEGSEPNWPKHFLMTHAIELAINAYLIFESGLVSTADIREGQTGGAQSDSPL